MTIEKTRKSNQNNSEFDPFVNAGLMTRTEGPLHTEYIEPWFVYIYKLTEEGKKYLIEEKGNWYILKRYETGIGEITQIKDINGPVHSAMVYYSIVAKNVSPFSVAWEGTPTFKDGRAEFMKGEDGWRFDGFR
ncbi:MAG: hypothetical protein M0D57_04625 [Sphingobacteriales bacterium JAD_PAG50586_3]|nr:MAG: hypothetical protein M0D57_04625 [Sphingobacteriales bacterium JAD_PAG50586_3]